MSINKLISYLAARPVTNVLIVIAYYLLVVLPHEQVGKFCAWLFDGHMTRDDYNLTILMISLAGFLGYVGVLVSNIRQKKEGTGILAAYLLVLFMGTVLSFKLLIVINIEVVHFVQYGILAVLLFPLVRYYWETACWILLLGSLDEAWQYFYLSPERTNYYDFNDVIINLIGGGFGMLLLWTADLTSLQRPFRSVFKAPVLPVFMILILVICLFFYLGVLQVGPPGEGENGLWYLIRVPQEGFWTTVHPNVVFHVIQPLEGLMGILLLLLFYAGLDRWDVSVQRS